VRWRWNILEQWRHAAEGSGTINPASTAGCAPLGTNTNTITVCQIENVLTDLQDEGMQPATLVRHLTVLKAAFNRAKRLSLVKAPKVNTVLVQDLMPDQESTLLSQLPEKYRSIVLTTLNMGLRQRELLRLAWADVDWNLGVLTIHETKAGDRRRVPINSTGVGLLNSLKAGSQANPSERVFPFDARYVRRVFEEAMNAAGVAPFRFHDCRLTLGDARRE
jgi:integrase